MKPRVLVVDDNIQMARMLADGLNDAGFDALPVAGGAAAIEAMERAQVEAVVTDLRMPGTDGLAVLAASKRHDPRRPVLVMTAFSAVDSAVESIRRGAYHYLTKPFKADELLLFLRRALDDRDLQASAASMRTRLRERFGGASLVGKSAAMRRTLDVAERVASSNVPVLLTGETGTGKSVLAGAIHEGSDRSGRPFVTVNCAAIPDSLLESELFGHVKGSFTGAHTHRSGLFVEANGGTLFLDEIGDMAPQVQAKVLHALERAVVRPVGAEREIPIDARIIAATNQDLRAAVEKGRFREDLFFRLDVVSIDVPPLRARRDDLPDLAAGFLRDAKERHAGSPVLRFSPEVSARFDEHPWPGNVRELKHVVERAVLLGRGAEVTLEDVPVQGRSASVPLHFRGEVMPIRRVQREYARWALLELAGARGKTAEALGVDGKTLAKWLDEGDGGDT